jgi:toxin YoeB
MKKFKITYTKKALKDFKKLTARDKKKVIKLLKELEVHPETGTGKVEQLKHDYSGYWSRRINSADRLIYRIIENEVVVLVVSAKGHY